MKHKPGPISNPEVELALATRPTPVHHFLPVPDGYLIHEVTTYRDGTMRLLVRQEVDGGKAFEVFGPVTAPSPVGAATSQSA